MRRLMLVLGLMLVFTVAAGAEQALEIDTELLLERIPAPKRAEFLFLDPGRASRLVLKHREAGEFDLAAAYVKLFFDRHRVKDEIRRFLEPIMPLHEREVELLVSDIALTNSGPSSFARFGLFKFALSAFGFDDRERVELVFLDDSEKANLLEASAKARRTGRPVATFLDPNLEGRLCGYAKDRHIVLGERRYH